MTRRPKHTAVDPEYRTLPDPTQNQSRPAQLIGAVHLISSAHPGAPLRRPPTELKLPRGGTDAGLIIAKAATTDENNDLAH